MIENNKTQSNTGYRQNGGIRVRDGLTFLLVGGGIGATLALLFAPKPGSEFRGEIADATRKGYDATREKASSLKSQSADKLQSVYEFASNKLNAGNSAVSDAVSKTSKTVSDGIDKVHQEVGAATKQADNERKSANIF